MMGGIPPSEAARLTLWEFTALRSIWNERHKSDDERDRVEPPSADFVRKRFEELAALGITGPLN